MTSTRVFADGEIVFIATVDSPEFIGSGFYLFDHHPQPAAFWVTLMPELEWFERATPIKRERHSAYGREMFERNCIGRLTVIWRSDVDLLPVPEVTE